MTEEQDHRLEGLENQPVPKTWPESQAPGVSVVIRPGEVYEPPPHYVGTVRLEARAVPGARFQYHDPGEDQAALDEERIVAQLRERDLTHGYVTRARARAAKTLRQAPEELAERPEEAVVATRVDITDGELAVLGLAMSEKSTKAQRAQGREVLKGFVAQAFDRLAEEIGWKAKAEKTEAGCTCDLDGGQHMPWCGHGNT